VARGGQFTWRLTSFLDELPPCPTEDGSVGLDSVPATRRSKRVHRFRGYLVTGEAGCTEAYCRDGECRNHCGVAWGLATRPTGQGRLLLYPSGKYRPISWGAPDCAVNEVKRRVPILEVVVTARIDRPYPPGDPLHSFFPDALIFTSICRQTETW
jgi:hypothetical protein